MGFEIFFDNPIIFIILVAVISSLFRKKKESSRDPKGQRRTNQPLDKSPSQTQTSFDEVREVFKELSRSFSNPTTSSNRKRENPSHEEIKGVNQQVEELNQSNMAESLQSDVPILQTVMEEKQRDKVIELDETKLVDAVVWSEILGPPRAKKPYRKIR
jgi:hypothetical protein